MRINFKNTLFFLSFFSLTFAQNATVTINTEPNAQIFLRAPSGDIVDSTFANNTGTAIFNNVTSVKDDVMPTSFDLSQNYPNPFAGESSVNVATSKAGEIDITVYNVLAQELAKISEQVKGAGNYRFDFGIGNIASQVLFYKVEFEGESYINKMTYFSSASSTYFEFSGTASSFDGIFAGLRKENGITSGANYTFIAVKSGKAALNKAEWIDGDKTIEMPLSDGITVSGVARGIDSDPLSEIYPLENATVSLDGAVVNTANDGRYWIGSTSIGLEILTISHPEHHNRTEYVITNADTVMNSNIAFHIDEDLEFFTYIFQNTSDDPGLRKPDPARGDTLSVFVGEPDYNGPAIPIFEENITQVANEEVPYSNGSNYFLEFTSDSSNAFVNVIYNEELSSTGAIITHIDTIDPTKITKIDVYFKSDVPPLEDAIRETVIKEMIKPI
ncbi:MAG: hypothetical protein PHW27_11485 [Melioribacteraceae bacterium]|nr:hypothetical protein [Melioribacteraceae bacterium]